MKILNSGEHFVVKTVDGEGLEYETTNNLLTPFKLIKTLSKKEVNEYETTC